MIDFACKRFRLDEIIKCSLGLTKAEFRLMDFLLKHDEDHFSTEMLSAKLKVDLSTAQRAVKKLHEKGVIRRMQENLSGGGYVFFYQIKDRRELRKLILGIVHDWVGTVEEALAKW